MHQLFVVEMIGKDALRPFHSLFHISEVILESAFYYLPVISFKVHLDGRFSISVTSAHVLKSSS